MAWRNSPVAFVGVLAAGGLSMAVQGFTPIYAATNAMSQQDVALLMFVMQFGLVFIQYPLGALSDRIDRRIVLIITCLLIAAAATTAFSIPFSQPLLLMLVFAVWAGAVEAVYSLANAHANDRTAPADFVPLASTMLLCWSVSATSVPLAITVLTPVFGPQTFIYAVLGVAVAYAAFVAVRLRHRETVPPHLRENFEIKTAQMPNIEGLVEDAGPSR